MQISSLNRVWYLGVAQRILCLNRLNHSILGYFWRLSLILSGHISYILPSFGSNMFRLSAETMLPTIVQRENMRPPCFMVQRARFPLILPQINPQMSRSKNFPLQSLHFQ